jgi:hypothetical protein
MVQRSSVYGFRSAGFATAADTVVSAAPLESRRRGLWRWRPKGEGGLAKAFGGAAFFRNVKAGESYLGV